MGFFHSSKLKTKTTFQLYPPVFPVGGGGGGGTSPSLSQQACTPVSSIMASGVQDHSPILNIVITTNMTVFFIVLSF